MLKLVAAAVAAAITLGPADTTAPQRKRQDRAETQPASQPASAPSTQPAKEELKLEDLFPEKSFFGPSASGPAFSHDGVYAAYLYRPYKERRHGSDLWLLDTRTGETRRVTKVSVMAEFQSEVRKVQEDRIEKAKAKKPRRGAAAGAEKRDAEADKGERAEQKHDEGDETAEGDERDAEQRERERGDWVSDDDADDEKAPRYAGIQSFRWSPVGDELLLLAGGDIYRYFVEKDQLVRQTRTAEAESDVQYLPDGSGYTYMEGPALMRVVFGSHIVEQLDPPLQAGETMIGYRLSPDGRRIVFLSSKSERGEQPERRVKIAQYTERFMSVREVPRQVSDDPQPKTSRSVYLYDLHGSMNERGGLWKVHTHEVSGPRDIFRVPEWSPDSNRVVFAVFEQSSAHVEILEADFPSAEELSRAEKEDKKKPAAAAAEEEEEQDDEEEEEGTGRRGRRRGRGPQVEAKERPARVAYRFLHDGGPNTPRMMDTYYCADGRTIVFLSEQTGFRQLHVLDPVYQAVEPLTRGRFEVYPFEISRDRNWIFATATREHPARRDIYRIHTQTGEMVRLSALDGDYSDVAVSPDGVRALASYVTFGKLPELVYLPGTGAAPRTMTDSHPDAARKFTQAIPEFFTYRNRHGHEIYGQMFKPDDWKPTDRRPLLIYVYGGPLGQRKMVTDGAYSSDSYFLAWYLTSKYGYVTCTIDPRGVSGYGGFFEKANFEQAGKPQVEDLVDGVKWLVANQGVDEKRVGLHGWSFGGFQTQMCLYTEPEVFACGMAGAGPTEWENYNAWYSTGTIGPSREGHTDLQKFSLLPLAKNLKARLLLVHGMEDANVLYQDTVRVYRELLKAGKESLVELFLDPTGGHHLDGDVKRIGRMRKYEEFLLRTLGRAGELAPPGPPTSAPASAPSPPAD